MRSNALRAATIALAFCCQLSFVHHLSAQQDQKSGTSNDPRIALVENGLFHVTKIEGDETWNILDRMEHYGVPGVSIAVIDGGRVAWSRAYGVKDKTTQEPVTTDTLFQCASISKPVSAVLALRLMEQGKLALDEDVNSKLTSWKLPENQFTADVKVTLKHLISHTGGVTVHGFDGYTTEQQVPTLLQLLDGIEPANSPPIRVDMKPGTGMRYSGGGYCVMQQMILDVTGREYPALMQEMVLGPLGMNRSAFTHPLPDSRLKEAASGYTQDGKMAIGGRHTYPELAAAGLWSTAEELALFFIELQRAYQGKSTTLLSQEMAQRMIDESLGIFTKKHGNEYYFGHGGWNEGFSSDASASRDHDHGIVVLTNGNFPDFITELNNAVGRVYQWPSIDSKEYKPVPLPSESIPEIVGRYNHNGSPNKITQSNGKLWIEEFASDPVEIVHVGDLRFACRNIASLLCFKTSDSDGTQFDFRMPWQTDSPEKGSRRTKLGNNETLPLEWLADGEFDRTSKHYLDLQKEDPGDPSVQEEAINAIGYQLLGSGNLELAIGLFRINTMLHPKAFNTFDSLGEAYMEKGEVALSIENYERSVELNPQNDHGKNMLSRLKARQE